MFRKTTRSVFGSVIIAGLAMISPTLAGEKEDALIANVTEAYGGDKLLNLQSFVLEYKITTYAIGQSRLPSELDENSTDLILAYDAASNIGSQETWFSGSAGDFHTKNVIDGDEGVGADYRLQEYTELATPSLLVNFGGTIRTTAPLLVRVLNDEAESAEYIGSEELDGRSHEVLTFEFPSSPTITLYIDGETYLISKMTRENPALGTLDYVFSDYTEQDGIAYATSFTFGYGGQINNKSESRKFSINVPVEDHLKVPENFTKAGENIDTSSLTVNRIADGVYHLGTGNGYSIFVDVGDYIIAAGGYPGITQRLEEYRIATGSNKPLKFQIVTHHHTDHLGGMPEVADMGASFVTVAENVDSIKATVTDEIDDSRFYLMSGSKTFGRDDGQRVEVYEISTTHAEQFLLFYVPGEKLIFMADHYGTALKQGIPGGNNNSISLEAAIEELGLDVEKIASAHNPRIMTLDDLKASNQKIPDACYDNRPICS